VQAALVRLNRAPEYHQTDNSTAATHQLETGKRGFNATYLEFMKHYEMTPRTIAVGKKEQNGDIEASNGALKRAIEQQLLVRGSRDFESHEKYVSWLHGILEARNRARGRRLIEEIAVMRPVLVAPVPEYTQVDVRVTSGGVIRVSDNTYSVPSRLRDEKVRVRVFDDRIEVFYGEQRQLTTERLLGKGGHKINYRHIVFSLLRKPGAFRRYRYRGDLYPTEVFHSAFEALDIKLPQREADMEYLRILHLAATTMETAVEAALQELLAKGVLPKADSIRDMVAPRAACLPQIDVDDVDLFIYDELLVDRCLEMSA
jgi:hypothetical protein